MWRRVQLRKEILELLNERYLFAKDLHSKLRIHYPHITLAEVMKELLALEKEGLVRREKGEEFNPLKPLATSLWTARVKAKCQVETTRAPPTQMEEVALVGSLPLLNVAGNIGDMIPMLDAVDSLLSSAKESIYLATPFIDASLTAVLARHYSTLSRLSFVRVMVDVGTRNTPVLERLKALIKNLEYKVLGRYKAVQGGMVKVSGLHLKALAVDGKLALIGTFNFRETHIVADYDLGTLFRGKTAQKIWKVLDIIWNAQL